MAGYDPVIPAGGSGKLTAKVKTHASQSGHLTKVVTVTTDDPVAKTIQLKMSFDVKPAIEVKPEARPQLEAIEGGTASKTLVLHRVDGKPLEVTRIDTGSPKLLTVTSRPATKKDRKLGAVEGDVVLEIRSKELSGFTQRTQILTLHTNHPKLETMRLPVRIRVKPVIAAMPAQVRLWAPAGEEARDLVSVVTVLSNTGKPFTITAVESSHPDVVTAEVKGKGSATRHTIALHVPAKVVSGIGLGTKRATLTIRTDNARKPVLEVPVLIARRRKPKRFPGAVPIHGARSLPGTPKDLILEPKGREHLRLVPEAQVGKPASQQPAPTAAPSGKVPASGGEQGE